MKKEEKKASTIEETTQKHILDLIVHKDDVSWKNIIFELISSEQMDPWDINISLLAQRFLEELKKLKEMDFRISGKVVLASAILLKLKADKLRDEELTALDNLIHSADEPIDLGLDELQQFEEPAYAEKPQLIPRTPQPRKRKVSVYDLVEALEKALEADANRPIFAPPKTLDTIEPPEHHIDISLIIREVYDRIYGHYEVEKHQHTLQFHHITRSADPRDIVLTFIPLLHLENARKVDMEQPEHFGDINVHLLDRTPPEYHKKEEPPEPEIIQGRLVGKFREKNSAKKLRKTVKKTMPKRPAVVKIAPGIRKATAKRAKKAVQKSTKKAGRKKKQ